MQIKGISAEAATYAADPTLRIGVTLGYQYPIEVPLSVTGSVYSEGLKKLGELVPTYHDSNPIEQIVLPQNVMMSFEQRENVYYFDCRLSQYGLNHIEDVRQHNKKRDVVLGLFLYVTTMFPNLRLSSLETLKLDHRQWAQLAGGPPSTGPDSELVLHAYKPTRGEHQYSDFNILSCNQTAYIMRILTQKLQSSTTISSSHWVIDYCKTFGIGEFMVVDLALPEEVEATGESAKRIKEAVEAIGKMKEDIQRGEWNDCAEHARPVIELIRNEFLINEILAGNGVPTEAANNLAEGLRGISNYASKFIHRVDKDGKTLNPEVKADKEDAYLIYFTCVSLVNALSQKLRKKESRKLSIQV